MSFPKRLLCLDALGGITAHTEYADDSSITDLGCFHEFTDSIIPRFFPNPQRKKWRVLPCYGPMKYLHSEWHVFGMKETRKTLSDPFRTLPPRAHIAGTV